ncbi:TRANSMEMBRANE PROTEIN-RELATED [Salix purpurea]|uniref:TRANSMEMBRANE PROTEIN-RELATED n=1 Tax=Salix purpurea TaxID=77065 RepID=A0A9Q0UQW1_SALPP|nr:TRANSMEMBRANE PROTEIN-RELATED [Salix purpurea]
MPATATIPLLLFLLLIRLTTTTPSPISGLDTFLSHQSTLDSLSTNDSFDYLPSSLKKSLSLSSPHPHVPSLIASLLSLTLPLSLHIRLVGSSFPSESSSLLHSFLSTAHISDHFHVITTDSHRLSIKHSPHFELIGSSNKILKEKNLCKGVYVYLINLGSQSKNYAYSYSDGDSSPGFTKCLGTIWTGKERYLWIDLSAGPVDYGPALSGEGVLPRGEFHPLAAMHGRPKSQKALLADLSSLIWNAYQVLLVPSLRIPVHFEKSLIVEFIHIYGSGSGKDLSGLDWKEIERTFMDEANEGGLLLRNQNLVFRNYEVNYDQCSICSFAVSRSINSYTSRFLFENYTLIVSEYLDSKRLHQILSDSAEEFRRMARIPEEDFSRVLPVYVFDLDYNTLLMLDRYHQSVAFRDMVIAVRTKTTQTVSDYSCNGRHVFTHTRVLERPLVGSILQSMWGVSPTHLSWSPRHNNTLVDYTWSVGQTPFGPFSEISSLSFVQKDAARRNVLLISLNYSITSVIDVLESIVAHGGDRKLLKQNQHVQFIQRWNLFKYKLDKAISAMSHLDFDMALFLLKVL